MVDKDEESDDEQATNKENKTVIQNAKKRLENYVDAIEYCQKHNINPDGKELLIKKKQNIEEHIKKMKKSKNAKSVSIYLPNEISPDSLFGKPTSEIHKEKADLLTSVNKSIGEHQKVRWVLLQLVFRVFVFLQICDCESG